MEIETAWRRWMLDQADVRGYVSEKVFKYRLGAALEGTGGLAVVGQRGRSWGEVAWGAGDERPTFTVECWADQDRNAVGEIAVDNAPDKAFALARVVDGHMHGLRDAEWGSRWNTPGLRVVSCSRSQEPMLVTKRDLSIGGQGLNQADLGEMALVAVVYDLHIAR